jgi:rhamnose transport system ATP-binding protein
MKPQPDLLLRAVEVSKAYDATLAVDRMTFDVRAGEVHGLVGENGAGKSTLLGMLGGSITPTSGKIVIDDVEVPALTPRMARQFGIAIVYQELNLCPNLSIVENVFVGRAPTRLWFLLDRRSMRVECERVMSELGSRLDLNTPIERVRIAEQQLTEIARALAQDVRVLILDEPTSSLTHEDFGVLSGILERLKDKGVAIVFVSHRLSEILAVCDRVTVMRDGRLVDTKDCSETSQEELARLMVGRGSVTAAAVEPARVRRPTVPPSAGPTLEVRNASRQGKFAKVSLTIDQGEIVGLAGLRGAGRHELADCLFGLDRLDAGQIFMNGMLVRRLSPRKARKKRIAYVPQDRNTEGIVSMWDVKRNLAVGNLGEVSRLGALIRYRMLAKWSRDLLRRFGVVPTDPNVSILSLSGGNQQKTVLGKSIVKFPTLLILLEPTRGVDVGAKAEIRRLIRDLAARGTAVLLVESELPELLRLCSRIYVMHRGRIVGEVHAPASEEQITLLAAGGVLGGAT